MQRGVADSWVPGAWNEHTEKKASLVFTLHFVVCSFAPVTVPKGSCPPGMTPLC